jgi:hypothetical protein
MGAPDTLKIKGQSLEDAYVNIVKEGIINE